MPKVKLFFPLSGLNLAILTLTLNICTLSDAPAPAVGFVAHLAHGHFPELRENEYRYKAVEDATDAGDVQAHG